MKFIYLCAAILILSFTVVPMFTGVSNEREQILASNEATQASPEDTSMSFEEMYTIAAQGQGDNFDPESLNAITPAAGADSFPSGFSGQSDAALTDAPAPIEAMIEPAAEENN
tara:strand:+ start:1616 stop:1954 length:339 start_codon:yes stop_codon:yes gene_type:complete